MQTSILKTPVLGRGGATPNIGYLNPRTDIFYGKKRNSLLCEYLKKSILQPSSTSMEKSEHAIAKKLKQIHIVPPSALTRKVVL